MRTNVHSQFAPQAIGPYSQAVWMGDTLYLSGQTPIDPATGKLVEGGISEQAGRVFDNLEQVLKAANLSMEDVIKVNVYLTSMANFKGMNEVYAARFSAPYPARTTVAVFELPLGAAIEIEMVAKRER
jgi:2-iminobutanoate/2-iminopropanoate deaminase